MNDLWKFPCTDPECAEYERVHRPYSGHRGKMHRPSITELAEMSAGGGEGMAFKAAEITARYVLNNYDNLRVMDEPEAIDRARKVHAAMWATDADMGNYAHEAAECFAIETTYSQPDDLYEHDAERLGNFITAIYDWFQYREPLVLASEFVVANTEPGYVGTGDILALVDGVPTYVDWKTHREKKADRKKKFKKWDLQCQAICLADSLRHYHGNQLVTEMSWDDTGLPRPERAIIVSIDNDGTYREFESKIDPANMTVMLALALARAFKPGMKELPVPKKEAQ